MVVALNTITSNFSLKMYKKFIYDCSSCKFFLFSSLSMHHCCNLFLCYNVLHQVSHNAHMQMHAGVIGKL